MDAPVSSSAPFARRGIVLLTRMQCPGSLLHHSKISRPTTSFPRAFRCGIRRPRQGKRRLVTSTFVARSSPRGAGWRTRSSCRRTRLLSGWAGSKSVSAVSRSGVQQSRRSIINKTALRHYMDNFDFTEMRLDQAFRYVVPRMRWHNISTKLRYRRLCSKLYLKAETQQVDRILEVFAKRYWDCNPTTIFGNASMSLLYPFSYYFYANRTSRCRPRCGLLCASLEH